MKKTILAMALLAATAANAEVVTVAGYGDTYEKALRSCQTTATAKVTGSWIASEKVVVGGVLSEEIASYDGAIINRTDVLSYNENAMVCEVDVDPVKDNKVITKDVKSHVPTNEIKKLNQDALAMAEALDWINNLERAVKPVVRDITYKPQGEYTNVYVDVELTWDTKWIDDVQRLMQKRNMKANNTNDIRNEIVGSIANVFVNSGHPIFASVAGELLYETHKMSDDNQICFARKKTSIADNCYLSGGALTKFHIPAITIVGDGLDASGKRVEWFKHKTDVKDMWEIIYPNKKKGQNGLINSKVVYLSPGIAIYTGETQSVRFGFQIATDQLTKIEKFEFTVKE